MKFVTDGHPSLRVYAGGQKVAEFIKGEFETADKAVIDALKRCNGIKAVQDSKPAEPAVKRSPGRPRKA